MKKKEINKTIAVGIMAIFLAVSLSASIPADEGGEIDSVKQTVHVESRYDYELLWEKYDPSDGMGHGVTTDSEQNVIIVGNVVTADDMAESYIQKISPDGTILWDDSNNATEVSSVSVEYENDMQPLEEPMQVPVDIFSGYMELLGLTGIDLFPTDMLHIKVSTFIDVEVDSQDNIVAVGFFLEFIIDEENERVAIIAFDSFVAKYSPDGDIVFQKRLAAKVIDFGWRVSIDSNDYIYVGENSAGFDPESEMWVGQEIIIFKLLPNGIRTLTFHYDVDAPSPELPKPCPTITDMAINYQTQRLWIVGNLIDVGGFLDDDDPNLPDQDICVVSFGPYGVKHREWQFDSGWHQFDASYGLVIDDNGDIIIGGRRATQLSNGFFILISDAKGFLIKFSQTGDILMDIEDNTINRFNDIALRHNNNGNKKQIVCINDKNGKADIRLFDSNDGFNLLTIAEQDIGELGEMHCVTVSTCGDIVINGLYYEDEITFATGYYRIIENAFNGEIDLLHAEMGEVNVGGEQIDGILGG